MEFPPPERLERERRASAILGWVILWLVVLMLGAIIGAVLAGCSPSEDPPRPEDAISAVNGWNGDDFSGASDEVGIDGVSDEAGIEAPTIVGVVPAGAEARATLWRTEADDADDTIEVDSLGSGTWFTHETPPGFVDIRLDEEAVVWGIVAGDGCLVTLYDGGVRGESRLLPQPDPGKVYVLRDDDGRYVEASVGNGCAVRYFSEDWSAQIDMAGP